MRFLKVFSAALLGLMASTADADVIRSRNDSLKVILNAGSTPTEVGEFTPTGLSMLSIDTEDDSIVLNSDASESGIDWRATIQRGVQSGNATFTLPQASDEIMGTSASQLVSNKTYGLGMTFTENVTVLDEVLIDGVDLSVLNTNFSNHLSDTTDPHGAAMTVSTKVTTPKLENANNITIDMLNSSNTTLSVTNSGAGIANLSVQGNITLGGTVGGVSMTTVANHLSDTTDPHGASITMSGTLGVNTINEYTPAAGVTIDGVLLKDNRISSGYIRSSANAAAYFNSSGDLGASATVSSTELGYLANVTSDIQTQFTTVNNAISNHTSDVSDPHGANMSISGNLTVGSLNTNLNSTEIAQLGNIGSNTISNDQWGYLGALDQSLTTTSNVDFGQTDIIYSSNTNYSLAINNGGGSGKAVYIRTGTGSGSATFIEAVYGTTTAFTLLDNGNLSTIGDVNASTYEGGTISSTEMSYLNGVTSSIQTQLNGKQANIASSADNRLTRYNGTANVQGTGITVDDSNNISGVADLNASTYEGGVISSTEFQYLNGVTSGIQGQINARTIHRNASSEIWGTTVVVTAGNGIDFNEVSYNDGFSYPSGCVCQQGDVTTTLNIYTVTAGPTSVRCYHGYTGAGTAIRLNVFCWK